MTITIPERPGRCRWCGCTDDHGCAMGCSWANRQGTLCSECVYLYRAMRSRAGRAEIAEIIQTAAAEALS